MLKHFVPVLEGRHIPDDRIGVCKRIGDAFAGSFSGFVVIETEIDAPDVRTMRENVLQRFVGYAAERNVGAGFPFLGIQIDEREQINRRLKDEQPIRCTVKAETVGFF